MVENSMYFDYNATTRVHPEVVKIMSEFMLEEYGNPGSAHTKGMHAFEGVNWARKQCASLINSMKEEIIFTSGGTEADNLALQGAMFKWKNEHPKLTPHLITCTIEHPAVYNTAQFLEEKGFEVTFVGVDSEGIIDLEMVENSFKENTILVSVMTANNEIGTIQPIRKIGEIAHKFDALFHTDAVQAVTKIPIDVQEDNIDMLSVSAHKFYGAKGTGFLFVKNRESAKNESTAKKYLTPLMYGGSQEYGMRPATENVPGIVGMGKAIEIAMKDFSKENERIKMLQQRILKDLVDSTPNASLNGSRNKRIPNNVNVRFEGIDAYDLMVELDNQNVAISLGAACHAQTFEPSRVLKGIGLSDIQAASSIRISLGRWTTPEKIQKLILLIQNYLKSKI